MSSISSVSSTDPFQATNLNAFVQFVNNFNAIGNALNSGDLSETQNALTTFQQGLGAQTPANRPFGNNTEANADFKTLSTAVQSGDLSGARKAYTSLQSDLEGAKAGKAHRHHHRAEGSTDTTPSDPTQSSTESDDSLLNVTA